MARLAFCADENVPHAFVTALESNGFTVVEAADQRGQETVDEELLAWCGSEGHVLVTNDRDFVDLDAEIDHAGLAIYTSLSTTPGDFVRAVRRIDRQFAPETMTNVLVWIDQWL